MGNPEVTPVEREALAGGLSISETTSWKQERKLGNFRNQVLMIIPSALQGIVVKLIKAIYEDITDPVEVMDPSQGVSTTRQEDGTLSHSLATKMIQPQLDGGTEQIVSQATARTAEYVQAAAWVQTDPTTGVGKVF